PNARVFSFGIGSSVNRFLLDKMAEQGRGEVEYVSLNDDGSAAAKRFHERVRSPLLTDISIDWAGLPVTDIYPKRLPDLFSAKPVVVCGRYTGGASGAIKLKGKVAGRDFTREITVDLPESEPRRDVLATLWARTRIDDLMNQDYAGIQSNNARPDVQESITALGLNYRLMTQFTSFVAVEEMTVTEGGEPRRVDVPVEMPEGVRRSGVFGEEKEMDVIQSKSLGSSQRAQTSPAPQVSYNSGISGGAGGGSINQPAPPPKAAPAEPRRKDKGAVLKSEDASVGRISSEKQQMLSKLHPSIAAVVERLKKKNAQPAADESKFVRNGKAEIQIWLADKSSEILAKLKQLGFEVVLDPQSAKMVIGRVAIEKLAAIAELDAVRYISPQM
ncbi:MAG TPA: hypothetical protein VLR90_09435, partial [Blastocatellia bacterium]|nr:hypothetical protein [Blastocatellia bacterium]